MPCAPAAEAIRCRRPSRRRTRRAHHGFQWSCDNAVVHQLAFHDMRSAADRCIYRTDLAAVELERDVVMSLRPDRRAPGRTASAIETTGGSGS